MAYKVLIVQYKGAEMLDQAYKGQKFIQWGCEGCYYHVMKGCSAYKLGTPKYDGAECLKEEECEAWEPA